MNPFKNQHIPSTSFPLLSDNICIYPKSGDVVQCRLQHYDANNLPIHPHLGMIYIVDYIAGYDPSVGCFVITLANIPNMPHTDGYCATAFVRLCEHYNLN